MTGPELPPAPDVTLRRKRPEDLDEVHSLIEASREHLVPWMPWAAGSDRASEAAWLRCTEEIGWMILDAGRIAGTCAIARFDSANRSASIGYWLAADAQGRGLATLATRAMVAYAFDELGLNRLELRAAVANTRSRAVAERCGFSFEGVLRQAERIGDGYVDQAVYSLLRDEADRVRGRL